MPDAPMLVGSIVRFRMPDSNCVRSALVIATRSPRPGHVRVRFQRFPTKAEVESGGYDRWVKQPAWLRIDDVIEEDA